MFQRDWEAEEQKLIKLISFEESVQWILIVDEASALSSQQCFHFEGGNQ